MSALHHILAADPGPESAAAPYEQPTFEPPQPASLAPAHMAPAQEHEEQNAESPRYAASQGDERATPNELASTSATTSTRRNASGTVSSVYSGNKIRHLKKEDGIPLWRKDIQYDFLRLVFFDQTKCFTKYSDGTKGHTFADVYIDAMAKSSKCSKILKEKLLQDQEGALCMAMVCLLVNVGRMNTTLNFFPEMRAQLRTYHSIPALQAHQDPNAYKQLQDAPRLKSILKGATEDEPQPGTIEDVKAAAMPRTNPVNLIFVLSQYTPKVSEEHFLQPRDFFDLVMRGTLSSASRARAFLWLIWWYLESDFGYDDTQRNPFGPGQYAEGEREAGVLPLKVPTLESLTEEQAAAENVDTEDEKHYGEVKRKERIAILASEPSPAMTALKRARKEKGLTTGGPGYGLQSDDDASEAGYPRSIAMRGTPMNHGSPSDYTRSPSPVASRGFQAVNAKPVGDMRINHLLNNEDAMSETSPPHKDFPGLQSAKKGPGRGNWRRNKPKQEAVPLAVRPPDDRSHHVPLLPNTGQQLSFVSETPQPVQPATPSGFPTLASNAFVSAFPQGMGHRHIPTPSYQAQKRHRGVTSHQTAVISHRKQQIDYQLDRRVRREHLRARDKREIEGSMLRAWKRLKRMPTDYDSEEEQIKTRKAKDRADKDDDSYFKRGKENVDALEDSESWRRSRVYVAGFVRMPDEPSDVGEEARSIAKSFRRCSRRLERWQETNLPGTAMIRREQIRVHENWFIRQQRTIQQPQLSIDEDGLEVMPAPRAKPNRHRSSTGKASVRRVASTEQPKMELEPDDEDGGGELDEEDRELLGEVDADVSDDEDEDDDMGDD